MDVGTYFSVFGALTAIVNPLAVLPMFLTLTDGFSEHDRHRTALWVGLASMATAAVVAVAGVYILRFFGIDLPAFQVASGVVLFMIALDLLKGRNMAHSGTKEEQGHITGASTVAFYPMTFPVVVGPGTIAAIILYASRISTPAQAVAFAAAIASLLVVTTATLWFAGSIGRLMSLTLRTVMTRVVGVLVISIAVSLISSGMLELFPGLAAA